MPEKPFSFGVCIKNVSAQNASKEPVSHRQARGTGCPTEKPFISDAAPECAVSLEMLEPSVSQHSALP